MSNINAIPKIKMADEYSKLIGPNLMKNYIPFFKYVAERYLIPAIDGLLTDPTKRSLTVGDYAAHDGKTLMCIAELIIEHVQQRRGSNFSVTIIYEDLPENDVNALFTARDGPSSLREKYSNVIILASGVGFYSQCVADGTMDIILCHWGAHWLSALPCQAKNTIFPYFSNDETEMRMFSERAATDWLLFLELRAKELRKGGTMLLGVHLSHEGKFFADDALDLAYKLMVEDNTLAQEQLERTTVPLYFRTSEEIRKPFMNQKWVDNVGIRLKADYAKHQTFIEDDLEIFIADHMYITKVVENYLHHGLAGEQDSKEETLAILNSRTREVFRKNGFGTIGQGVQVMEKI